MNKIERALRDLCIAIAEGDILSDRFNTLLLESGIFLDDAEWQATNRLLSHSTTSPIPASPTSSSEDDSSQSVSSWLQ